jgi:hypothetical protein
MSTCKRFLRISLKCYENNNIGLGLDVFIKFEVKSGLITLVVGLGPHSECGVRNIISLLAVLNMNDFERVLTIVYNTQSHWPYGLWPSSDTIKSTKHYVSETGSVSVFR